MDAREASRQLIEALEVLRGKTSFPMSLPEDSVLGVKSIDIRNEPLVPISMILMEPQNSLGEMFDTTMTIMLSVKDGVFVKDERADWVAEAEVVEESREIGGPVKQLTRGD